MARRLTVLAACMLLAVSGTAVAQASVTRFRAGSSTDVTRPDWSGPAFTMNGSGAVVDASMRRAVDTIRGGSGTLDVVVLAGSTPASGSRTPECDAVIRLAGVNSCTTWVLTRAADGDDSRVNADIRNAEFVYFAGGDQCRYAAWKGTALQASVRSVVAKGGGAGGGSAGTHITSSIVYNGCGASVDSRTALADPYSSDITFTTGMFAWPDYGDTINDSHFVTRDRMGRLMAFTARAVNDGLTSHGAAWGVGVEEGGSLFLDRTGLATLYGQDAYVVLADHRPERAVPGEPLTYRGFKIWRLRPGSTFDFHSRPTTGYYLRDVDRGTPDADLYTP
ncbi:cyanophycinase [Amycolatopsis sp. Hca4]|uniref:cyanophycinase n=1 Tax=Amycolatopsis sp. Hca4 TaxID=2742131 RepID=UPI0015901364|nr:hypothetical protein [Amycolatopsis sp. Hca4]QKV73852.1 hypothetical protein HUT10_08755 [Amycolatopsis sp. Hca4]